jgi:hypothetical protein
MQILKKRLRVGMARRWCGPGAIFVTVELTSNELNGHTRLSLTGQIGRHRYGQIDPLHEKVDLSRRDMALADILRLDVIWRDWHLNDMSAGCEHQRKAGWGRRKLTSGPKAGSYSGQAYPAEGGCLTKQCRICGYKYGSAWIYRPLPREVMKDLLRICRAYPHVHSYYGDAVYETKGGRFFVPERIDRHGAVARPGRWHPAI